MELTTRKVLTKDVLLLKNLQQRLRKKGIKVTQHTLLSKIIRFASSQERALIKKIMEKEEIDPLDKWLETQVEGKESDAVEEHDLGA